MKSKFYFFILLLMPLISFCEQNKAITYSLGSRLGDNILAYTHAKWISYKWGIPLLYQPFEYSDLFILHDVEQQYTGEIATSYTHHKKLEQLTQLDATYNDKTLFFLTHFPDSIDEYLQLGSVDCYVAVDWSDEVFRQMMRELISPKNPITVIHPPKDIVTVALHYRTGEGFDTETCRRIFPLRFPYPDYYLQQLNTLYSLVGKDSMYVYVFTDHPNPPQIKRLLEEQFPFANVTFDCRMVDNRHDANVLEDLFSMMQFDCQIRPVSHYSTTASRLGNFKIEICPKAGHWDSHQFTINDVHVNTHAKWDPLRKVWISNKALNQTVEPYIRFESPVEALDIIQSFLPVDPQIIDSGAYIGTETIIMANKWPQGHIFAFEPIPEIYQSLLNNTASLSNVTLYDFALSDKNGSAEMHVALSDGQMSASSSLLAPKEHINYAPYINFPSVINVQTNTLDTWAQANNIDHIDMMWLDMQGVELNVLKASPEILKKTKVILTEVEFVEAYKGQYLYHDLKNWLYEQGFVLYAGNFNPSAPGKDHHWYTWYADALFIRKELLP